MRNPHVGHMRQGEDRVSEKLKLTPPHLMPESRPRKPETRLQALMEAAPNHEPEESDEDVNELHALVADVFDGLDRDTRLLLEAIIFERLSYRQLAERFKVGKSTIERWYAAAILELRGLLIEYPEIRYYLEGIHDRD